MRRRYDLVAGLLLALMGTIPNGTMAQSPTAATPPTYIIPIKAQIERGLLYALRRGIAEANRNNAGAIIIDMDTPGGRLDAAEEIVLLLLDSKVPTYTFVNPRAISAGAIIALATDKIYMTPTGLIGDAMPIMMSPVPMGGTQAIPDDMKEKVLSPTVALVRSAAQRKGHDPALGEAMVRPDFEYVVDGKIICPAGQLLTLTADDAAQRVGVGDKARPLLSSGTVANMDALLKTLELDKTPVVHITISSAEKIARIIDSYPLSGILMALGLLGLYIEFKTPGFGFPGVAGILLLAIWFWGHHIAGLAGSVELLMLVAGIGLLMIEIFILPGFGIAGMAGVVLMVASLAFSMLSAQPGAPPFSFPAQQIQGMVLNTGTGFLLSVGGAMILARFLPQTRMFRRITLERTLTGQEGFRASPDTSNLIGRRGQAVTDLRPAGIGTFDGQRLNVVSRGVFIAKDKPIVIAESHGNRIVVDSVAMDPR